MKCSKCECLSESLVHLKNKEDLVMKSLCYPCLLSEYMTRDVSVLDQHIQDAETILKKRLVEVMNHDKDPRFLSSPVLKSLIEEQKKFYELLSQHIDHVRLYRDGIVNEMDPLQRMKYDLKIAIGEERFEDAQMIYDQIKKIA